MNSSRHYDLPRALLTLFALALIIGTPILTLLHNFSFWLVYLVLWPICWIVAICLVGWAWEKV